MHPFLRPHSSLSLLPKSTTMSIVFVNDDGNVEKRLMASIANCGGDGGNSVSVGQRLTVATR